MPRAAAIASHSARECSRTALLAAQVLIAASLGLPVPASSQATPAAAAEPRQAAPAAAAEPRQARPAAVSGPSTAGRPAMPLAMPSWVELGNYQREALAPLQPVWNGLPAASKRSWLALTEKLPAMQAADREAAQKRIREWAALSPEQRRMARDNFRLAKSLDRDERLATWESYRQLTPEQRTVLRDNGWTSNTAARHAGAATGLAKEAARPLASRLPASRGQGRDRLAASGPTPAQPAATAPAASPVPGGSSAAASPSGAAVGAESPSPAGPGGSTESAD
jgi:hypothetical protein